EAAALLERLAAETGRDDLLFDAGQARFAAGHRAHALRLWQAYADAPGRSAADIALAARRIADARALTTQVTFVVHVSSDMSKVTLTARRRHDPPDAVRPPLALDLERGEGDALTAAVALDPGVWEIAVAPDPGGTVRRELVVDRAPQTVELTLAPPARPAAPAAVAPAGEAASPARSEPPAAVDAGGEPTSAPRSPARPRLAAVFLPLAATSAAAGAAVALTGARRFERALAGCSGDGDATCREQEILAGVRHTGVGAGLAGAGVGLLVTGVTALAPTRTAAARRRAWAIEAGVGGAAAIAGVVWLALSSAAYGFDRQEDAHYLARIGPWFDRRAGAAALLGVGSGLVVGAVAGLVAARGRPPRNAARPAPGLSGAGLALAF
ncbi:MAG TPA: hypothetical protein VIK91_04420, partial [Nannocystis sp.]